MMASWSDPNGLQNLVDIKSLEMQGEQGPPGSHGGDGP